MKLSDLIGREVVGIGGWRYGRVHDVRVERDGSTALVRALIIGTPGLRERLFGRGHGAQQPQRLGHGYEIPWHEVVAISDNQIRIEERQSP